MCGIAGIAGFQDDGLLDKMVTSLTHRGPDDVGTFHSNDLSLGARRLAVIDPAGGHQPMVGEDGDTAVVLNGEIYNHVQLRAWLEGRGHEFSSACDTEVVLHGIEEEGTAFLSRMEGMFALAMWDGPRLVLARDRLGIKPMVYTQRGSDLLFASEVKALFKDPELTREVDREALAQRFVLGYPLDGRTLFAGVRSLAPGTALVWDARSGSVVDKTPFWELPKRTVELVDPATAADELATALEDAVRSQLVADVPLGAFLSGGVDSALIAALANEHMDTPLRTFTLGESHNDPDVIAARAVAETVGSDHTELVVAPEDVAALVPRFVLHMEQPNYESVFFLALAEVVRRRMTVALCGQGADELFGGYPRYSSPRRYGAEVRCTLRRIASSASWVDGLHTKMSLIRTSGDLMDHELGPQLAAFQLSVVDRASMAAGLEVRVPYLATPVVELSRRMDTRLMFESGAAKAVLRRVARKKLPPKIADRPKRGAGPFTTPRGALIFEQEACDLMDDKRVARHPYRKFFRRRSELVCMDILAHSLIEGDGQLPDKFTPGDLY